MFGRFLGIRAFSTTQMVLGKKKGKTDTVLVLCKSIASDFMMQGKRTKLGDKLELLAFDPIVQKTVLFKEAKKVKTLRSDGNDKVWWLQQTKVEYPEHFNVDGDNAKVN
jgi:ribosomal protein L33